MRYWIGLLILGIGIIGMFRPLWLSGTIGRSQWAERHLGTEGGSRFFYRLIGMVLFVLSLTFMLFRWPF